MSRPPGVSERVERRKKENKSVQRDSVNYGYSDSGCAVATEHLGFQSMCLACPFSEKCRFD